MLTRFFITILISLLVISLILFLGGCGKSGEQKTEAHSTAEQTGGNSEEGHEMSGEGLDYIYTADNLYSCEMHPVLISDNPEAMCPRCNMKLTKMSDEAVAQLRTSNPKGCEMCGIVVPGESPMEQCPKCGMDLAAAHQPEAEMAEEEAGSEHEH